MIIPNWTDTDWTQPADERRTTELWKEAWKTANWKSRPDDHFEAYWLLLHKRSPRFWKRSKRDEAIPTHDILDPNNNGNTKDLHTISCDLCYQMDTHQNAYLTCPQVRNIWETATPILEKLTGLRITENSNFKLDFYNILFAFPALRKQLPKRLKPRVILWHSVIIHLIWKTRNHALAFSNPYYAKMSVEYETWKIEFTESLKSTLRNIYHDYKSLSKMTEFKNNRTTDCSIWTIDERGDLHFLEPPFSNETTPRRQSIFTPTDTTTYTPNHLQPDLHMT